MTDVVKSNFERTIPEIVKSIETCTFVAIDAEYTGIYAESKSSDISNSLFDSAEQRYTKLRKNLEKYMICQLGIAIFQKNPDENELHVETYNIYLFPVSFDSYLKREAVHIQISCANFLASNDFDFNKFIKEGSPYLNKEREKELQKYLKGSRHCMSSCELIDEYFFPEKIDYLTDNDIEEIVDRLKGVSKIVHALHECERPIVGHNVLQDLLLLYQQFWADLPHSYAEFKFCVNHMLPTIYDTKVIAWELYIQRKQLKDEKLLGDTNLFKLYSNLSSLHDFSTPLVVPVNDSRKYQKALYEGFKTNLECVSDAACHEAGFDALVTGAVFIKLAYLSCRPNTQVWDPRFLAPTAAELFSGVLKYKNTVNLARAQIRHIKFDGDDPVSHRPDYIRVKSSANKKGVSPSEIRPFLAKFGDVEIVVIDSNSVLLACSGMMCARNVYKDLSKRGYILSKEKYYRSNLGYLVMEYINIKTFGIFAVAGCAFYILRLLKLAHFKVPH